MIERMLFQKDKYNYLVDLLFLVESVYECEGFNVQKYINKSLGVNGCFVWFCKD